MGHSLDGSYLPENLVSFYYATISDKKIPDFSWHISKDTIYADIDPESEYQIHLWEAINESGRDFKSYVIGEQAWQMEVLEISEDGSYAIPVSAPASGYKGALVEVVFNPESDFPLTLTTGTVVTPDSYPFDPYKSESPVK